MLNSGRSLTAEVKIPVPLDDQVRTTLIILFIKPVETVNTQQVEQRLQIVAPRKYNTPAYNLENLFEEPSDSQESRTENASPTS